MTSPFAMIKWDQRRPVLESICIVPVEVEEADTTMDTVKLIRAAAQHLPPGVTVLDVVLNGSDWSLVVRTGGAA